jgi:hypothetical protein
LALNSESNREKELDDATESRLKFPMPLCMAWRRRSSLDEKEPPVKGLPKGNGAEK